MPITHHSSKLVPGLTRDIFTKFSRVTQCPAYSHVLLTSHILYRKRGTDSLSSTQISQQLPPGFSIPEAQKNSLTLSVNRKAQSHPEQDERSSKHTEPYVAHTASLKNNESLGIQRKATEQLSFPDKGAGNHSTERIDTPKTPEVKGKSNLTIWQKIRKEVIHYWDGTKLLVAEVKISSKLALKMAAGYELTRREHRQLHRTVQDLGRLIPFSVFVIVPFAELLLPIALRLFPNLLPSTYEGQKAKDAKATNLRATRKEVSNFLRQTLKETGLPVSAANAKKNEFAEFFRKVRTTGETPTPSDVVKVCKIFKDDLTLDNLSRPQLVAICRYMSMTSFGTDNFLRYQIRHRMRQIKRDDRAISFEGVESLSVPELQTACASRGLRTHGVSPARLRDDLQMWLDLRLKYGVPSTLLVLSNAFMYAQRKDSEFISQIDALQSVLSSIPEELYHEIELEVHNAEGAATNKQRLEVLKEQQELIDDENEQNQDDEGAGKSSPRDRDNIDEDESHAKDEPEGEVAEEAVSKMKSEAQQKLKNAEQSAQALDEQDKIEEERKKPKSE